MKDEMLPPRPGEKPKKAEIKGVPFVVYINGSPIEMSKTEAISVMAQIVSILSYLDDKENKGND